MRERYTVRIAWERFDWKKAFLVIALVLSCCISAIFITARPAVAGKQRREVYKYYTAITVQQGDTLWSIAEEQLHDKLTASEYKGSRSYMKEVISLNDLRDGNYLLAGQKLIVPYYSHDYKN